MNGAAVQLWLWYPTGNRWVKAQGDVNGRLVVDPSDLFEDTPTDGELEKAPTSNWSYDHDADPDRHHAKYTDAEAKAAAVQAGAITDGVTKAPTHDAVYDVKQTADGAIAKSLLTTLGDIIRRGAAAPERLGAGVNGQVLTMVAGQPAWAAPVGGATLVVSETEVFNGTSPTVWTDLDLSGTIGANVAIVLLKFSSGANAWIAVRKNGDTDQFYYGFDPPTGCAMGWQGADSPCSHSCC